MEGFSNVGEFQEFVLSGNEDKLIQFYTRGHQSPILGGDDFSKRVREKIGANALFEPPPEDLLTKP